MLLNLTIRNYRSIKEEETFTLIAESSRSKEHSVFTERLAQGKDEIRLLNTAAIYGSNASGKTNIFRCLFEIIMLVKKSNLSVGEPIPYYDPFLFSTATKNQATYFCIEFIGKDNIKYKYHLEYNGKEFLAEELVYYPKGKEKLLYSRSKTKAENIHSFTSGTGVNVEKFQVFNNQTLLSKFGKDIPHEIISEVYLYIVNIDIINASSSRKVSLLRNEVSEFLDKHEALKSKMDELIVFSDFGINALQIKELDEDELVIPDEIPQLLKSKIYENFKFNVKGVHTVYNENEMPEAVHSLPLDEESHGTKTLYCLGGKILKSLDAGSVLFIDELETGLSNDICKMLISLYQDKRINSKNAQLIFTTHNTNLLDRTMFRKDQIWFAEKDATGKTELFSLQDFNDVREDTPFDKWYLAGKFGAIPNLKSLDSLFVENGKN